jgi:hypothetical protein
VRPAAQVDELALLIKGKRGMIGQSFIDVLDLQFLLQAAADFHVNDCIPRLR